MMSWKHKTQVKKLFKKYVDNEKDKCYHEKAVEVDCEMIFENWTEYKLRTSNSFESF